MIERAELDAVILEAVRDVPPPEWVTADLAQRMVRTRLGLSPYAGEPSLAWVARRLAALASRGDLERQNRPGAWVYRAR